MEKTPFEKHKAETFSAGIDFTGHLPAGATLSSGTVKAYLASGKEAGTAILSSSTLTIDSPNNIASADLAVSLVIGKILLAYTVVLSNADILQENRFLYVRE